VTGASKEPLDPFSALPRSRSASHNFNIDESIKESRCTFQRNLNMFITSKDIKTPSLMMDSIDLTFGTKMN